MEHIKYKTYYNLNAAQVKSVSLGRLPRGAVSKSDVCIYVYYKQWHLDNLLNIRGKMYTKILWKAQEGFRPGRGCRESDLFSPYDMKTFT